MEKNSSQYITNCNNMEKQDMLNLVNAMSKEILKIYDNAGDLRDYFTGVKNETVLKEYCNTIRKKLYEIQMIKGDLIQTIKKI